MTTFPPKSTLSSATAKKATQFRLDYDGKVGQLYKLMILDILLSIITLGIYSFWGKARLRKYLVSHHALGDDRFEYTGTGGELFKGFLKALPILAILLIPLVLAEQYPVLLIFYIPLIYFFGIAVYGALRYRYNRTRWRGISGFIEGSTIGYANLAFGRMLLNIISFGLLIPSSDIKKHSYIMNNAYFGTIKAEYNGNSSILFGAHIKSILLALAIMSVISALVGGIIASNAGFGQDYNDGQTQTEADQQQFNDIAGDINTSLENLPSAMETFILIGVIFGFIILPLILRLTRSIYHAALMREKVRGLKIGNLKFMCTVGAWDIIKHRTMNTLILIITLGFGFPFIVNRNMKFFARHHIVMGDLETFHANQAQQDRSTTGEGLDAALDLDIGFM